MWHCGRYCHYPHFIDGETEAQSNNVIGPRSHSQLVGELGFELLSFIGCTKSALHGVVARKVN